jgi:hypothetical protein
MGGFHGWHRSLGDLSTLNVESYPEMLIKNAPARKEAEVASVHATPQRQEHHASDFRILVTESEILDKSKGDPLGKLFTVLQTTWFIVQYLERWVTHQPRMQLEVMTLAYAALNILVYALWWDKPLNIQEPIDVHGRASTPVDGRTNGLHGIRPVLVDALKLPFQEEAADSLDDIFYAMVFPLVGILFGGVHCFAWWFPFPTVQEKVLWRVCAVYCTTTPCLLTISWFILYAPYGRLPGWVNDALEALRDLLVKFHALCLRNSVRIVSSHILPWIPYIACRVILVILTFTSLRAPPPGIYKATSWPSFLPHFG